ncbi:MAG: 4-hydroxy-tetrahydrodipicolinate synthase [Clostridia bacterium]|nr:4-hydroxy-tetrahydrodipicolinate synthase [Clostridia bacterium]
MKKTVFTGAATAIVTPLTDGGIDYDAFGRLIEWQVNEGIDGIVVCGTTGESSTLTDDEHKGAIEYAVKKVAGRVPVIAGTGSNDTAYAVELTQHACKVGVDGVLLVTPYYNKATQKGLVKMFSTIADKSTAPVILYNVPSRTGVNIEAKTVLELSEHPNISGIKEASGNITQVADIAALTKGSIDIYSGNDDQTVPIMSLGGKGCISVLSNLLPKETSLMCKLALEGNYTEAAKMQLEFLPLVHALFSEVNPIPVKSAMAKMGFCEEYLRLPLTVMEQEHKKVLFDEMQKIGIKI